MVKWLTGFIIVVRNEKQNCMIVGGEKKVLGFEKSNDKYIINNRYRAVRLYISDIFLTWRVISKNVWIRDNVMFLEGRFITRTK